MKIIKSEVIDHGQYSPNKKIVIIDKDLDNFPIYKKHILDHELEHYRNHNLSLFKRIKKDVLLEWKTDLCIGLNKEIIEEQVKYDEFKRKQRKINNTIDTTLTFLLRFPTSILKVYILNVYYIKYKQPKLFFSNLFLTGFITYVILDIIGIV